MEEKKRLTFNSKQVRTAFKSHYCKELSLPSGKPSGYYIFPITDEEINELSQDLDVVEKPKRFLTWSEWALFVALRRKYGTTYLRPKTKQECFLSKYDTSNLPQKEENPIEELEEKLTFYCENRLNDMLNILQESVSNPEPERDTEKQKNFRNSLDNVDLDVLY